MHVYIHILCVYYTVDYIFLETAYTDYDVGKYSPKLFKAMDVEEVQYVTCIYIV